MKKCRKCKVEYEATEQNFNKCPRNPGGLKNECKGCVRKYNQEKLRSDDWLKVIIG